MTKHVTALAILFASFNATAAIVKRDCEFQDYQNLTAALEGEVRYGAEYVTQINGILVQEMGPVCKVVYNTVPQISVPGDKTTEYELSSGETSFTISVTQSMEQNAQFTLISKK
jgi:hypothetical protein